jgi:hypothetical protein
MKNSIKTMFVVLAIFISFAFVKSGWTKITTITGPYTVTGKVVQERVIPGDPIVIYDSSTPWTNYPVRDWGPDSYWDSLGVSLPMVGDDVTVDYYRVFHSDEGVEFVVAELIAINGETVNIPLHDYIYSVTHGTYHLIPLWH